MSESSEVELISFENPTNPDCRLFIPQIHWPAGSESELAEFLRERLLPHGLPHSVYVAKCTPGEYGNKVDEDDAGSLHFAFISFYSARNGFNSRIRRKKSLFPIGCEFIQLGRSQYPPKFCRNHPESANSTCKSVPQVCNPSPRIPAR